MLDVLLRLNLCVYHVFEKEDTSSIRQMHKVLDKDNVSSFVQFQSCCVTHGLFMRAIQLDECHLPVDKTAYFSVCGLPHLCSVCVSIPAA